LRRLVQATRAVAAGQRRRAAALREVADAYVAEADGGTENASFTANLRASASRLVSLAEHADSAADALDQQAALVVLWASNADQRAGERRRSAAPRARAVTRSG
jgi:hypothetical protein